MAFTSSRITWLPRWRDRRQGRRYRTYLLEGNVLVRSQPLLPHLERLPLLVEPDSADMALPLHEALLHTPHIRLVGAPSSGRRLALRQLCLRWAQGEPLPQNGIPLLYQIPAAADPHTKPLDYLCHELASLGFEHDGLVVKRMLAAGMWLLLIEGLDRLEPQARTVWQRWLQQSVIRYPALSIVVADTPTVEPWPMFSDWRLVGWQNHEAQL